MELPDSSHRNFWLRSSASPAPVIIFVHGRKSNVRECWLNETQRPSVYWPHLALTEPALDKWGIFLAGYNAFDSASIPECAKELYQALDSDGEKPLERESIVFVTHSLGGVVVRKILVDHYARFKNTNVFLFLLASPSAGANAPKPVAWVLLGLVGLFRDVALSKQLTFRNDLLVDLDSQFRRLLNSQDERYLANLDGIERSEAEGLPVLGRIVGHFSASRYFGESSELLGENHSTICKPPGRHSPAHQVLVRKCQEYVAASAKPTPPRSYLDLIRSLQVKFNFQYVPPDGDPSEQPVVYWPVRLRPPTPIHAQQTFVAAALTKQSVSVEFWLDDLGNVEYGKGSFEDRLMRWFVGVGGDVSKLTRKSFKEELGEDPTKQEAWSLTRKWLGDTQKKLGDILRISKLLQGEGGLSHDELFRARPRRLLTPAIVWLGLRIVGTRSRYVVTLGGEDETELWEAWRNFSIEDNIQAGHLYGPRLSTVNSSGKKDWHMKTEDLAWDSVGDIKRSFAEQKTPKGVLPDEDTLSIWSVNQCVFLPQFVAGEYPEVSRNGRQYRTVEELLNLPQNERDDVVIRALEARLL